MINVSKNHVFFSIRCMPTNFVGGLLFSSIKNTIRIYIYMINDVSYAMITFLHYNAEYVNKHEKMYEIYDDFCKTANNNNTKNILNNIKLFQ